MIPFYTTPGASKSRTSPSSNAGGSTPSVKSKVLNEDERRFFEEGALPGGLQLRELLLGLAEFQADSAGSTAPQPPAP